MNDRKTRIEEIVGKYLNSREVESYLSCFEIPPEEDEFAGMRLLDYPSRGIMLYVGDNDMVVAILLHSEGHEEYSGFIGELPFGSRFSDDQEAIRRKLGTPSVSGLNETTREKWDRFDCGAYSIHAAYGIDLKSVQQFTLMTRKFAAGDLG